MDARSVSRPAAPGSANGTLNAAATDARRGLRSINSTRHPGSCHEPCRQAAHRSSANHRDTIAEMRAHPTPIYRRFEVRGENGPRRGDGVGHDVNAFSGNDEARLMWMEREHHATGQPSGPHSCGPP